MTSTPLFLRSYFRIDPILTPTTYSICTFLSATAELFLTLPFQTVLRRGQIHLLQQESDGESFYSKKCSQLINSNLTLSASSSCTTVS